MSSPSIGRSTSPAKFPPKLISDIETRAGRLGLKPSAYIAILVHNDLVEMGPMKLRRGRAKVTAVKRQPMTLSFPLQLRKECMPRAKKAGGNFTAYLEHLATEDTTRGGPLTILLRP